MTDVWNLIISDGHGGLALQPLNVDLVGLGAVADD